MSKLLDDPIDTVQFLPLLLLTLETNASGIADPEARNVTEKVVEQLNRLKDLAKKAVNTQRDVQAQRRVTQGLAVCVAHMSVTATLIMNLHFMEDVQWTKNLWPVFGNYFDSSKSEAGIEAVCAKTEKMMEILEGRRSCCTTPRFAFCGGRIEGFPDSNKVRTVFVEADIQGKQSHLSCIEYVYADENIQALDVSSDQVCKMLATVGFVPDGKTKAGPCCVHPLGGVEDKVFPCACHAPEDQHPPRGHHQRCLDREPQAAYEERLAAFGGCEVGQEVRDALSYAGAERGAEEPTTYLDRKSLGILVGAIEMHDGGGAMITHGNEFCSKLCPETWVMDAGHLEMKGDAEWMLKQDTKI
ncbi:hypothetical protein ACHAWF_008773 [Thalassiosira exigua]